MMLVARDWKMANLRASQPVQQQVAVEWRVCFSAQHQNAMKTELGTKKCGSPAVIRLQAAAGDDRVAAFGLRLGQREFKLANLVAAEHGTGQIIALDPDRGAAEPGRQPLQRLERRRSLRKVQARRQHHITPTSMCPSGERR